MKPSEAQQLLLEHGFHGKWEGRHFVGGSTYLPGNPGKFEGLLFRLTLLSAGEWEAELTDFEGQKAPVEGQPNLESVTAGLLQALRQKLSHDEARPSLWLGVQLGHAAPNAKSDVEALSRLFVSEAHEADLRASAQATGLKVIEIPEDQVWTEEMLLRLPLGPVPEQPKAKLIEARTFLRNLQDGDVDPVEQAQGKPVVGVSPNARPYCGSVRGDVLEFCWAPLSERDSWPTQLKVVHHPLSIPREMTTTLLISALCQIFDTKPEWLDLILFSTEPVDGKVTACFYGSKADPPKRDKPEWLAKLVAGITPLSHQRDLGWRQFWKSS